MFVICDSENVVQDIASTQSNLARCLPYLDAGGHLYENVESSLGAWIGDHFDGAVLMPDSPLRGIAEAEVQENTRLAKVMAALVGVKAGIEAEVDALTLAEVTGWLVAINNVGASPNAAIFATRWAAYEKKRTLFEIELIRYLCK